MRSASVLTGVILAQAVVAAWAGLPTRRRGVSFPRDTPSALRLFEQSISRSSADASGCMSVALLYRDLDRPDKALAFLERAARLSPEDPDVQAELGWAKLRQRDPRQAARAFSRALALSPAQPQALLGVARLALDERQPQDALEPLEKLAAADPDSTLTYVYRGRAYEALGDARRAAEAFHRAYRSDPTYAEVRLWLGPLYTRLRDFDLAWLQYSRVLDVDPKNKVALHAKAWLSRRITRKPSQLAPQNHLRKGLRSITAPRPENMPAIRVAVGTTASGSPIFRKALAFSCAGTFQVVDPQTGRRLLTGQAGQVWLARKARGHGTGYELMDSRQRRLLRFRKVVMIRPANPAHSLLFKRLNIASGTAWEAVGDRQLKGSVEIRASGSRGLYLVDILSLEDYLYGVVNGEMPPNFPEEALKAQAVIARNHALYTKNALKPHRLYGYDLCDGQHCQVYGGMGGESEVGRKACDSTRGLILTWHGHLAQTPYSANCGGHTQNSSEVLGWGEEPYLKGSFDADAPLTPAQNPWELERWLKSRPKAYCNVPDYMHPSHFRWSRVIPADALGRRVNARSRIGRLRSIRILRRNRSGNVSRIEFRGTKGRYAVNKENDIREVLGLAAVRSTLFAVESERDKNGFLSEIYLYGGGWGHGVGLCQCGAAGRATAGQTMSQILVHYFPGTQIQNLGY